MLMSQSNDFIEPNNLIVEGKWQKKNHIVNNLFIICMQRLSVSLFRKTRKNTSNTVYYIVETLWFFSLLRQSKCVCSDSVWYGKSERDRASRKKVLNSFCPDIKNEIWALQGLISNAHWTWLIYANEIATDNNTESQIAYGIIILGFFFQPLW